MGKTTGIITQIKTLETHDGPGIRTTIFFKGCPLNCVWCSNPETKKKYPQLNFIPTRCKECGECLKVCPIDAVTADKDRRINRRKCNRCMRCIEVCHSGALEKVGMEVTPEEIVEKVEADVPFYKRSGGGVTLSGGEPLSQPEFVLELLRHLREKEIHISMDTCGYGSLEYVKQMMEYVDLVLLDIKQMDPKKHRQWTGVSNEFILNNAEIMVAKSKVRISLPLIPGVNDDEKNINETIKFAKTLGINAIDIMPFHQLGTSKYQFLGLKCPYQQFERISEGRVKQVIEMIESSGLKTSKERSF